MHKIKTGIIKKYSNFLIAGEYFFNNNYTKLSLVKDNINQVKDHDRGTGIKRRIDSFFKDLFIGRSLIIKEGKKTFEGKVLLIPSTNYGVKIFSDNDVLTFYHDISKLQYDFEKYNQLKKIFNTPKLINKGKNYIITEKIDNGDYNKEDALNYFMNSYIEYFSHNKPEVITKRKKDKQYKIIYKNFYNKLNLTGNKYLATLQHGDLWSGNILGNNKNFYIIDYENANNHYVLYDFFKYIYSEAYILNNYKLLENYFSDKYDKMLEVYLKKLDITYKKECKKEYFFEFLDIFIEDRIKTTNLYIYNKEINFIKEVLRKLNL